METIWDWSSVLVFAGLVTLMLQRSSMEEPPDKLWHYAPPAIGCGLANYAGNEEYPIIAVAILAAVISYTFVVLKPFDKG